MSTEITCMEHAYTVSFYLECILLSRRVAFHLHAKEFRYGIPMGMECTQSKRLAVTKITVFPTRTDFLECQTPPTKQCVKKPNISVNSLAYHRDSLSEMIIIKIGTKVVIISQITSQTKQKNVKTNIVFYECAAFLHIASGKQLKI